jgi:DNA-binding CsgD family transcriptional regulator/PAS domain-containing protein
LSVPAPQIVLETAVSFVHDLNPLIDSIHDASLGLLTWTDALWAVAERIGAQCVTVQTTEARSNWSLSNWCGIDPPFRHAYENHYLQLDPMSSFAARCQPGIVVTDRMIISRPILERTEFYQGWVRPQGLCRYAGANLSTKDGIHGVLSAGRGSATPYRQQDIDVLVSLLPHIQNAVRTVRHFDNVSLRELAERNALDALAQAVVIVDGKARVIFANRAAELMFSVSDGIATSHQRLVGMTASSTSLLHALISGATGAGGNLRSGGAMLLDRTPPSGPLQVLATPLGNRHRLTGINVQEPAAMLMLVDSLGASRGLEARLAALFRLTPAEARVACEIAEGRSPKDVAERLRVMPSTIRTHLHHVFTKTATRGQGDLIRLIAQIAVFRLD